MILTAASILLAGVMFLLAFFWFACPRWWPDLVIKHSPSLRHALLADSYRSGLRSDDSPPGGRPITLTDYARFEQIHGDGIFAAMAACVNGSDPELTSAILLYLGRHMHQPAARAIVWRYSDRGNTLARSLINNHANTLPQGINASQVMEQNHR